MRQQDLGVSKRWKTSSEKTEQHELPVVIGVVLPTQPKRTMEAEELGVQVEC